MSREFWCMECLEYYKLSTNTCWINNVPHRHLGWFKITCCSHGNFYMYFDTNDSFFIWSTIVLYPYMYIVCAIWLLYFIYVSCHPTRIKTSWEFKGKAHISKRWQCASLWLGAVDIITASIYKHLLQVSYFIKHLKGNELFNLHYSYEAGTLYC